MCRRYAVTGWTTDLDRRVREHNAGRSARYTRGRRPVRLVYWESIADRDAARRREAAPRCLPRRGKLVLIDKVQGRKTPR